MIMALYIQFLVVGSRGGGEGDGGDKRPRILPPVTTATNLLSSVSTETNSLHNQLSTKCPHIAVVSLAANFVAGSDRVSLAEPRQLRTVKCQTPHRDRVGS